MSGIVGSKFNLPFDPMKGRFEEMGGVVDIVTARVTREHDNYLETTVGNAAKPPLLQRQFNEDLVTTNTEQVKGSSAAAGAYYYQCIDQNTRARRWMYQASVKWGFVEKYRPYHGTWYTNAFNDSETLVLAKMKRRTTVPHDFTYPLSAAQPSEFNLLDVPVGYIDLNVGGRTWQVADPVWLAIGGLHQDSPDVAGADRYFRGTVYDMPFVNLAETGRNLIGSNVTVRIPSMGGWEYELDESYFNFPIMQATRMWGVWTGKSGQDYDEMVCVPTGVFSWL